MLEGAFFPDAILLEIFSLLNEPLDIFSASEVCKRWHSLANSDKIWTPFLRLVVFPTSGDNAKRIFLEYLKRDHLVKQAKVQGKVLLLGILFYQMTPKGCGECGKATLFKQVGYLYGSEFRATENNGPFKAIIEFNTLMGIRTLIQAAASMGIQWESNRMVFVACFLFGRKRSNCFLKI